MFVLSVESHATAAMRARTRRVPAGQGNVRLSGAKQGQTAQRRQQLTNKANRQVDKQANK